MAKASLLPLLLSAGTAVASGVETRKTRKTSEKTTAKSEADATAAIDEAAAATETAETAANLKRKKRASELATGGRAAHFKPGLLGEKATATTSKKTLFGG